MLSEFGYPPRLPGCCVRSSWCSDSVPVSSPPIDGLNFLDSCGGSREEAGITTGAVLSSVDDGAGPSAKSEVPLVDVGIGSVMTSSGYTHTTLGEQGPSEIHKECSLEEGAVIGTMGHAANENGGRQTVKAGKTTVLKRASQDRPEAPRRKRIHVCGSNFGEVEGRMHSHAGAGDSTFGGGFSHAFYMSGSGRDADDGEEGTEKASTNLQHERAVEVENGVMDVDVEMTEVTDDSGGHGRVDACLPRVEERSIGAREDDGDVRSPGVPDGDVPRPVNLAYTQVPDSDLKSPRQEGNTQQSWEGMANGVSPHKEIDSGEASVTVLPSEAPRRSGEIPEQPTGTVQQTSNVLGSESGRDDEMHDDIGDGFIEIRDDSRVNEEDLSKHVELSSEDEPRSRNGYPHEDVEVIEVDDSDDDPVEMNGYESDGSLTKGTKPVTRPPVPQNGFRLSASQSTSASFSPDEESDSDDCQVVGEWKPNQNPRRQQRNKADSEGQDDDSDTEDDRSEESDSSDVQVAGGPQSEIQRGWEEAAMRRRMGRAMKSAGSKVNGEREATADLDLADGAKSEGLAESVATSAYRDSPDSTAESSEARGGAEGLVNPSDGHVGASLAPSSEGRLAETLAENKEINPPGTEAKEVENHGFHMMNGGENQAGMLWTVLNGYESHREELVGRTRETMISVDVRTPTASEPRQKNIGAGDAPDIVDLIALREKLKQTPEFLQADEEEWASRQQELLRQQLEAQKMRQRKRVEADRKLEMERKQKLRVQELRQSQMKIMDNHVKSSSRVGLRRLDSSTNTVSTHAPVKRYYLPKQSAYGVEAEKDMDEKEQLRGQVRDRLEYLASKCTDLASLLRRLGINVDGGNNPSEQQVNAAFKRALVKFHPDRVVDGDARRMVEAEEAFKLINRMKKTLDGYDPFR